MQFTTSQARAVLAIPSETLRYWRRILTPLADKPGSKAARFDFGEILALAVVARLVSAFHIDVGALAPIAPQLFDVCKRPTLLGASSWLCINLEQPEVFLIGERLLIPGRKALVLLPIYEMSSALKNALLQPDDSSVVQREFSWPLASVK